MKKLLLPIIAIFLFSCGNKSSNSTTESKPDTIRTVALFQTNNGELRLDYVFKIIKDSVKFSQVNEDTQKKTLTKDTTYFVPIVFNIKDTTDKTGKKDLLDSLGKPRQSVAFVPAKRETILHDFNKKL